MISINSLDLQVVGELIKQSPCLHADHFFILYVNGYEVCRSQRKTREPPPRWKEQKRFRFEISSTIRIVIFRQSLLAKRFPVKKYIVAEFNGKGVDLLDNSTEHEMTAESGDNVGSRISVRLDYSSESHAKFMKAVDEDMSRIGKVPGSDAAQAATTTAGQLGTVLQKIVPIVDEFAGSHPVLNAAWTVLSAAYKVIQNQIAEDGAVRDLLESLREMAGAASACPNLPEVGGTMDVLEEIGRTSLEAALLIHEYASPSVRGKTSIFARTAKHSWTDMSSRVAQCQKQCKDLIAIFNRRLHLDTNSRVKGLQDAQTQMVLDKLVYAEGASWDPTMACLPGTRATILSVIRTWARSIDGQNVFWLNGVAGSGKSAIAHTIAQALHTSSFFFKHNDASRNTSKLLFPTIARDIAMIYPAIAADIRKTLEDDPKLASASLSRQFEAFISGPLSRHPIEHPFVIVIDALDETINDEDSDMELLRILRDEVSKLPPQLRILVTSRSTRDIVDYLSEKSHITSHPIDIASVESGQDIETYIGHQLGDETLCKRMGFPGSTEVIVRDLKNLAEGLFIWIVTVFRYLRNADNPEENLRALLSKSDTPGRLDPRKRMDSLYTVMIEACGDWADPEFCKGYKMFMGAIMAAKRPLSLTALRALHGGTPKLSRASLPQRFGSVLMGLDGDHKLVRVLHFSFHEFITEHTSKSSMFHIAEKEHSGRLAELCLQTMVRELETTAAPIRGTGYLLKDDDDEPGIPKVFGVSEQLLYSCEYWSDHILDVEEPDTAIAEVVKAFLPHHNTTWIEIVSSMSIFRGSLAVWHWLQVRAPQFQEQGHESQASILLYLSRRLKYAGRLEEALIASQETVDLRRALATEQPATCNADLACALDDLSTHLLFLGQREEALMANNEAVDLYRCLAVERPAVFCSDLARSLTHLSANLSALGRHEEAVRTIKEALVLYRSLEAKRPVVSNGDLAKALRNLSALLSGLGLHEEALPAVKEALDLYRTLAAERPFVFNADLARCLVNLSVNLSGLGLHEEGLAANNEAVDLYRILAKERPASFNDELAKALGNLSMDLAASGRREEGLAANSEAVDLYRALAAERPAAFNGNLAGSLSNLSVHLEGLDFHKEAMAATKEAVNMYHALAAERPAVFNSHLAMSLANLSELLADLGLHEEGLAATREAVGLYRALAAERPLMFNVTLAKSLGHLSRCMSTLHRHDEALVAIQEAVYFRRALAADRPSVHSTELVESLEQLSTCLLKAERKEEAQLITLEVSRLTL